MPIAVVLIPYIVQTAKNLHAERSLLMRRSWLVSRHTTFTRMQVRWILSFPFRSRKTTCFGTSKSERVNPNKSSFMQAKACTQKQAFNVNTALGDLVCRSKTTKCHKIYRVAVHGILCTFAKGASSESGLFD